MQHNRIKNFVLFSISTILSAAICLTAIHPDIIAAGTATMPSYGAANMKVVDISNYQDLVSDVTDNIDFAALATQVDAVYIRSFAHDNGVYSIDRQAVNFAQSAQKVGMKFGFYYYYIPTTDPANNRAQAAAFYSFIKNYGYSCIPALDVEDNTNGLTKAQLAESVKIFADEFKSLSGMDLMIYTYPYFMYQNFDTSFNWSAYRLWIANYDVSAPFEGISSTYMPSSKWCWSYWDMWQYTSSGTLSSIPNSAEGYLDLSYATDNILLAAPTSAEIQSIDVADTATAGSTFTAQITVRNTDKVAWTEGNRIRLGIGGTANGRVLLPDGVSVAPGASYTFTYTGTAPASGDLVVTAQMLKEGVTWFGDVKTATVHADQH